MANLIATAADFFRANNSDSSFPELSNMAMATNRAMDTWAGISGGVFGGQSHNPSGSAIEEEYRRILLLSGMSNGTNHDLSVTTDKHPEPIDIKLHETEKNFDEYESLANELGFRPLAIQENKRKTVENEIREFMLDNGMPMYDGAEVAAFMQGLVNKLNRGKSQYQSRVGWSWVTLDRYTHAIPKFILERALRIKKHFKDKFVTFSVTDYHHIAPDPFIQVSIDGGAPIVFGAWDEPGFGLQKKDEDKRA